MKKLYSISYSHIGGTRSKQTTDINQLSTWLDEALTDEYTVDNSIVIETEEREV